jgi:proteasome lid subunit RPN8/RPN11
MTVRFSREVYDELVAHGRRGAPEEVCGVLGGRRDGEGSVEITVVRPVDNVADRPHSRYELDPAQQYEAMSAIEADDHEVVGFYHSHPNGPPRPSGTDRSGARWPEYRYVIVSLGGEPFVGAWRWTGEAFDAERVSVEGPG